MLFLPLMAGVMFSSHVQKLENGVVLHLPHGLLRLMVCSDTVIRATSTPEARFSTTPSLVITGTWTPTRFQTKEEGSVFTLSTAKLHVRVDLKTGSLAYSDLTGRTLLDQPSFPAFAPKSILDQHAYGAEIKLAMSKGEAYYGLGGHQNGVLDYAGESVQMVQANTEDVNPFLISSKGYGLLWDSPSGMAIDLGGHSGPIPAARLFDDEGKPGGLTGNYFKGRNFDEHARDRKDASLDFDWSKTAPEGLQLHDYSVRWTGSIETGAAGEYAFATTSDDGTRLWIDGKLVVDNWREQPPTKVVGRVRLAAHKRYPVKLEYYQAGGGAAVSLGWREPSEHPVIDWSAEFADEADTYFIYGPDLDGVVRQYRHATGAAPLFGKWAYGFWQCKERYKSQQELLDIAKGFRDRKIPIDNIVQDWFYWDPHPWGSHEFDLTRYPDMKAGIKQLHDENLHLMISVWGKFAPGSANYDKLDKAGVLYPQMGDWGGEGIRYYDAFSHTGREIYWRQMRDELLSKGVDAWWLDATEPEVDMERYRSTETALGPGARVLNAYSLMDTAGVYHGQRKAEPDKRVFILTRSTFAGQQRNAAATWSGDIQGDWGTFARQIPCGLNFCMAGVPYWCTDIGGFFSRPNTDPDYQELFVRWFQYGAFCPIFRVHGTGTDKEPWRFGPEKEAILTKYDRLRYRLMPYIYSLAWKVTNDGYTMMRGLPMDFRTDSNALNIDDQFMFGPSLLINPVIRAGATSRQVYLPRTSGKWFDFWTGESYSPGKSIEAPAPLARMPIYVRAGSIVPMGPELQFANERASDPTELRIYPGASGSFEIYEDGGEGYGYEHGQHMTIQVRWNDRTRTLSLGARKGSFEGMPVERTFRIVLVHTGHGIGIASSPSVDRTIHYRGRATQIAL